MWELDKVELLPTSAEARGLLALMLLHDSRRETRLNAAGELILLDQQDRTYWDHAKIQEGIAVLDNALALHAPGPYQVQAAISALHAALADLLCRTNQLEAAADAYERVLALRGNPAERAYLQRRLEEMPGPTE